MFCQSVSHAKVCLIVMENRSIFLNFMQLPHGPKKNTQEHLHKGVTDAAYMLPDQYTTWNNFFVNINVVDASLHKALIKSNNLQRGNDAQSKQVVIIISKIIFFITLDYFFAMVSSSLCERLEKLAIEKKRCQQGCYPQPCHDHVQYLIQLVLPKPV